MKRDAKTPQTIEQLVSEVKSEREPRAVADLDWGAIEARVMARVADVANEPAPRAPSRLGRLVVPTTLAIAAAAAVVVYLKRPPEAAGPPTQPTAVPVAANTGGAEASSLREGELHVGDTIASAGRVIRSGDALSVSQGRAVLERTNEVSWLIERDGEGLARARVTAPQKPLVLSLEHGAIEAQVVPVPSGEAFAVDIATRTGVVRVAVHGTHLRVARAGDRVVVDLSEGVVSIGVPPRTGITTGTTVTAPAHVELDATDLGTLRIDKSPSSVRAPIALSRGAETAALDPGRPAPQEEAVASAPLFPSPATAPRPAVAPKSAPRPRSGRDTILAAVRQCATSRATSGTVRVTVASDLKLTVSSAGVVELAQFTPPLPPDIQSCAAETIYKTKLDETGTVSIPISFSY